MQTGWQAMMAVEILLVEDNPGDVRLTREAMKEARVSTRMHVVPDGAEAMAFLRGEGRYAGKPRPDLILLDLNVPRKNGLEVLAEIKGDDRLKRIPVVVLSSSQAETDILESYNHHANCYIAKPADLDRFLEVVRAIETFWLSIVKLPKDGKD
jgi:CheY-like chemotaxis protein